MTTEPTEPPVARMSISPRAHNSLSYSGAAIVMAFLGEFDEPRGALVSGLWIFHFARRTAESLWVHRYGGRGVPPADYLVEYLYYWGFGAWVATGLASPSYEATTGLSFALGLSLFVVGQAGNTWAHQKLRQLRPSRGDATKSLPHGGLFSLVACPHYLFEITTWAGFALLSGLWASLAFFIVGAAILASYAFARHLAYQKQFDGKEGRPLYPPSRRALLPFIF